MDANEQEHNNYKMQHNLYQNTTTFMINNTYLHSFLDIFELFSIIQMELLHLGDCKEYLYFECSLDNIVTIKLWDDTDLGMGFTQTAADT